MVGWQRTMDEPSRAELRAGFVLLATRRSERSFADLKTSISVALLPSRHRRRGQRQGASFFLSLQSLHTFSAHPSRSLVMAQHDPWMRDFEDALRIAEDIISRISERNSSGPPTGSRASDNLVSAIRRKITMLGTRLDSLQSLLSNHSLTKSLNEKELNKRQEMVQSLRTKMNQLTASLESSQANRSNLLGQDGKIEPKENNRTSGVDNAGIVGLQRQIMQEQDEELVKLEETVTSTKHIALAVNEELDLHTRLLDNLDKEADTTNSRLRAVQGRLSFISQKAGSGCSMLYLIMMVFVIVILVLIIYALIRYL